MGTKGPQGAKEAASPADTGGLEGGCACGALRYRLAHAPLFVHACHCTRCQRETGGPFAHHLMLERTALEILQGTTTLTLVPTDSGRKHWVARCAACATALWNVHGSHMPRIVYLRVGTLDEPAAHPPRAHIYVRSKQPWVVLDDSTPRFAAYYDAAKLWPQPSLERYVQTQAPARRKPKV